LLHRPQRHQQYIAEKGGTYKREESVHGYGREDDIDRILAAQDGSFYGRWRGLAVLNPSAIHNHPLERREHSGVEHKLGV
jgi:hypothetical protein